MKWWFVCTANICRSPFAHHYALKKITEQDLAIEVDSFGLNATDGQPCPASAIAVSSEFAVDLQNHRSQAFYPEIFGGDDLFFVMEHEHRESLLDRCPECEGRVFLLADYLKGVDTAGEVPDPFGLTGFHYRSVYTLITRAVDCLFESFFLQH